MPLENQTTEDTAPKPDAAAPDTAAPAKGPEAGTGDGTSNEPKSSFDALSARLKEIREDKSAEPAVTEAKPAAEKKADAEDEPGETPEEKQAFKGKSIEDQVKTLRGERRTLRKENETLRTQVAEIEPLRARASQFDDLAAWTRTSGLTQAEFTQGLQISALMKSDPFKALEVVTPIYQELQRRAGAVLPEDLAAEVESGQITEARAQELARARQERVHLTSRNEAAERSAQERDEAANVERTMNAVRDAVNKAEAAVMAADVDYGKKKNWIAEQVKALWVDEGMPTTPEAAVAQYKKAVKLVNDRVALITPRRQTADPITRSNSSDAAPEAKSSLDAMRLQLEKAGRRVVG